MAQFDVYRNAGQRRYPLLVDLQADLLRDLATRVVAPLLPLARLESAPITHLNPVVSVDGERYVVALSEMAALPVARLRRPIATLRGQRRDLIAGLDLLFTGI